MIHNILIIIIVYRCICNTYRYAWRMKALNILILTSRLQRHMPNITIIIIRILHSTTLVAVVVVVVVVTLAERRAFSPDTPPPSSPLLPRLIRHQHSAQPGSILTLKIDRVHSYSMGTLYNIIMCIIKRVCSENDRRFVPSHTAGNDKSVPVAGSLITPLYVSCQE